jgi:hypothetical protein
MTSDGRIRNARVDVGVAAANSAYIALEIPYVGDVEADLAALSMRAETGVTGAHDSDEEPDVGLGQLLANEVLPAFQNFLDPIERLKHLLDGLFVHRLLRCEARTVYAVCAARQPRLSSEAELARTVDVRIDPLIQRVDLRAERRRVQIQRRSVRREEGVERGVEDADDLR